MLKNVEYLVPVLAIFAFAANAAGQHGIATTGAYPPSYKDRQTWTGLVTAVDQSSHSITLTYDNDGKEETFSGTFVKNYWDRIDKTRSTVPDLVTLMGRLVTAYYSPETKKGPHGVNFTTNRIYIIHALPRTP